MEIRGMPPQTVAEIGPTRTGRGKDRPACAKVAVKPPLMLSRAMSVEFDIDCYFVYEVSIGSRSSKYGNRNGQ